MAEQGTSEKRNVRDDVGAGTESEAAENEGADAGQGGTAMGRTTGFAFGGSSAEGKEGSDDSSTYKEMKGGRSTGVKGGSRTGGNAGGGHGSTGGKGKKRASKAGSKGGSKGGAGKGGSRGGEGGRGGATRPAIKTGRKSGSGGKAGSKKR
jgi:23S rRNA pseudouridine2605 synthase